MKNTNLERKDVFRKVWFLLLFCQKWKFVSFILFASCVNLLCIRLSNLLNRILFLCRAMDWFFWQTLDGWLESTFLWRDLLFLPNFGLFWTKNMEKEWSHKKINAHIWTLHSQIPLWVLGTNSFSLSTKILGPENHYIHIASVMWPESLSGSSWGVNLIGWIMNLLNYCSLK